MRQTSAKSVRQTRDSAAHGNSRRKITENLQPSGGVLDDARGGDLGVRICRDVRL